MKLAGKVRLPCARLMVTVLSSSGCRKTSSPCCPNSGISSAELRLSLEQHAAVHQADLTRARPLAAADESRVRDGVVRGAEGVVADQRHVAGQHAGHGVDPRDVQRLGRRHTREDGGEGAGEQPLAGAGRAGHQDVVPSVLGDLQRPFNMLLNLETYTIIPVTHLLSSDPGMKLNSSEG